VARDADRAGHRPAQRIACCAREDDRLRAISAGFDLHVTKPVDPGLLLHTIADLTSQ
jgi:CheY-like chemotaxis protein